MTTARKLKLSKHARWRARQRGITSEEINDALQSGHREARGGCVLHFDLRTHVAILVNWRRLTVITVIYLCKAHYARLRAQALNNNESMSQGRERCQ